MSRPHHGAQRGHQLIARFLGEEAIAGGPFALLGIDPSMCTPTAVEAGLERQLDRVSQHPEGDTAEADQVRLALDTAANELLDPITRAAWIDEVRRAEARETEASWSKVSDAEPGASANVPVEPASPSERSETGSQSASRESGRPKNADPFVMRLLFRTAVGLGVMVLGLGVGLWFLSRPMQSERSPTDASVTARPTEPSQATNSSAEGGGGPSTPNPKAAPPATPPPPLPPLRVRGRSEFADGAYIVKEFRAAVTDVATDVDRGVSRFERAHAIAADWWCRYEQAQIRAAADSVVELIYRVASHPDQAARVLAILTEPLRILDSSESDTPRAMNADEVWPAAWAAGMLARANRERELPPQILATLGASVMKLSAGSLPLSDMSFDAGATSAFSMLPRGIIAGGPPPAEAADETRRVSMEAMKRWVEGVTLANEIGGERRERQLIEALGWVIAKPADPDSDPRVFDAITLLASEIKWKAGPTGGGARARLIDWFRDPRISSADLRALTSAIATKSGAEGVEAGMVLSMSAQADDRPRLRDRYAQAWGIAEAATQADSARKWVQRARPLIDAEPPTDELVQFSVAVELADVNRQAVRIWRGESIESFPASAPINHSTYRSPTTPQMVPGAGSGKVANPGAPSGTSGSTTGTVTGEARDGAWAEEFLRAERNIPIRLEKLAELEQVQPPIGWIDAGVLAETACFGSPSQVRAAAQKIVGRFSDEPAMVSGMLDLLPIAPRLRSVSDTYARVALTNLPRPADADWELTARRALVERLLSMIADEGMHGQIEHLALRLATAYLDAVGEPPPAETADGAATGAVRGARMLVVATDHQAASLPISPATRFNLPTIQLRAEQRRAQAVGPVQAFGAEQVALAETLGCLLASEHPEREAAVAEILDEMAALRRKAAHVYEQIWSAERAIAKLWMLRLNTEAET